MVPTVVTPPPETMEALMIVPFDASDTAATALAALLMVPSLVRSPRVGGIPVDPRAEVDAAGNSNDRRIDAGVQRDARAGIYG